jgi:hypothetical protein
LPCGQAGIYEDCSQGQPSNTSIYPIVGVVLFLVGLVSS